MLANLENSAVATGLEKVSFHSNPKEKQSPKNTQTQFCLSLCGVSGSWCAQGFFESSEHLLCVWGLILNAIQPFLLYCQGFSFALGCGLSFFDGILHSPVDGSAESCNFGFLTGEEECISFYPAILFSSLSSFFFFCIKNYVCNFNKIVYKLVPIYSPHLSCHFGGPAVKMLRWEREQLAIYLFKSLLLKSNHLKVNIFQ